MPSYASVSELKSYINYPGSDRVTDMQLALDAASRWLDRAAGWPEQIWTAQTLTEYLDGPQAGRVWLPRPYLSLSSVKTDDDYDATYETTWASTDYIKMPLGAGPYTYLIEDPRRGTKTWPTGVAVIEVTGSAGLTSTAPQEIKTATIILAHRLFNRSKTPEGVMGSQERGFIALKQLDPDVQAILELGGWMNPEAYRV